MMTKDLSRKERTSDDCSNSSGSTKMVLHCRPRRNGNSSRRPTVKSTGDSIKSLLKSEMISLEVVRSHHPQERVLSDKQTKCRDMMRLVVKHSYHDHFQDPIRSFKRDDKDRHRLIFHESCTSVNHEPSDAMSNVETTAPMTTIKREETQESLRAACDLSMAATTPPVVGIMAAFPERLHDMLSRVEAEGFDDCISWQPHGRSFLIHQKKKFVENVMSRYFHQTKLTSFQRQLNLYGFIRLTAGRDRGSYYHELFLRGRIDLCRGMIRTRIKGNGMKAVSSPQTEPDFYAMPYCTDSRRHDLKGTESAMQNRSVVRSSLEENPESNCTIKMESVFHHDTECMDTEGDMQQDLELSSTNHAGMTLVNVSTVYDGKKSPVILSTHEAVDETHRSDCSDWADDKTTCSSTPSFTTAVCRNVHGIGMELLGTPSEDMIESKATFQDSFVDSDTDDGETVTNSLSSNRNIFRDNSKDIVSSSMCNSYHNLPMVSPLQQSMATVISDPWLATMDGYSIPFLPVDRVASDYVEYKPRNSPLVPSFYNHFENYEECDEQPDVVPSLVIDSCSDCDCSIYEDNMNSSTTSSSGKCLVTGDEVFFEGHKFHYLDRHSIEVTIPL